MSASRRRGCRVDDPLAAARRSKRRGGRRRAAPRTRPAARHPDRRDPRQPGSAAQAVRGVGAGGAGGLDPRAGGAAAGDRPSGRATGMSWWPASDAGAPPQLAGQATIPALVDDALDEAGSLELALIENLVREDLSAIEQAPDVRGAARRPAHDQRRARQAPRAQPRRHRQHGPAAGSARRGRSRWSTPALLSKGHGKALLAEPDHHRRRQLARQAAERGWSVRALESEIARAAKPASPRPSPDADQCAVAARLQDAIARAIGCEATAMPHRDGLPDHPRPPGRRPAGTSSRRRHGSAMMLARGDRSPALRSTWNSQRSRCIAQSACRKCMPVVRCASSRPLPPPALGIRGATDPDYPPSTRSFG